MRDDKTQVVPCQTTQAGHQGSRAAAFGMFERLALRIRRDGAADVSVYRCRLVIMQGKRSLCSCRREIEAGSDDRGLVFGTISLPGL